MLSRHQSGTLTVRRYSVRHLQFENNSVLSYWWCQSGNGLSPHTIVPDFPKSLEWMYYQWNEFWPCLGQAVHIKLLFRFKYYFVLPQVFARQIYAHSSTHRTRSSAFSFPISISRSEWYEHQSPPFDCVLFQENRQRWGRLHFVSCAHVASIKLAKR